MESTEQIVGLNAETVGAHTESRQTLPVDFSSRLLNTPSSSLQQQMLQAISNSQCLQDAARALAIIASQEIESLQIWFCQRGESSGQVMLDALLESELDDLIESTLPDIHLTVDRVVEATLQSGKLVRQPITNQMQLVSAPVFFVNHRPAAFVVLCFAEGESQQSNGSATNLRERTIEAIIQLTSSYLTLWQTQKTQSNGDGALAKLLSANLREIMGSNSRIQACSLLCTRLSGYVQASHLALFSVQSLGQIRLAGFSGTTEVDRSSQVHQALQTVCLQIANTHSTTDRYRSTDEGAAGKLLQQTAKLLNQHFSFACEIRHNDRLVGIAIFVGDTQLERLTSDPSFPNRLEAIADQMSCSLQWHQSPTQRLLVRAAETVAKWKWWGIGALALVTGLGFIPAPYQMNCECRLDTTHKRFVVAPFVGRLSAVMVEPGSLVEADQILAKMDDRDLRLELIGKQSEFDREIQKSQTARAAGNMAEAKIAELESQRIQQQINLLDNRLLHQEIRSPILGTIVQGDLRELQGAPVELGQNLFEVAPLEKLVVEISLPEYQYRYASVGQSVKIHLDAYPFDQWTGTVARLKPEAEIRDGKNIFVAEVVIENKDALLRPGMKGQAYIKGDSYPIAWNWLHYPYEKARGLIRWF